MQVKAWIEGVNETKAKLLGIEPTTRVSLCKTILKLSIELQAKVIKEKLSGNPLKRVTGDLSRSVYATNTDDGLTGIVGANTPYAARQEYGFKGVEHVREYMRRNQFAMLSAKFNQIGLETRPSKAKGKALRTQVVRAHTRNIDYPEHSYLRSALNEMRGKIAQDIEKTIRGTAREAMK